VSREEIGEIYEKLLARDYARVLFADLAELKPSGRGYMARCPFHADKSPSFSISTDRPVYHCFGCDRRGDWLTYIQEREGLSFPEALDRLAKEAGVELQGRPDPEAWARERSRADLLERALKYFQEALFMGKGKETLDYLTARGYAAGEIKRMELGHYPGGTETAEFFKTLNAKDAGDLFPYLKWRDDYKAIIPYRDPLGNVKSLWGRLTRPLNAGEKEADKYKPHAGDAAKSTPFNLDRAKRSAKFRDFGELLAVEGYFDALAVREKSGLDNVIALGGSSITAEQLETFRKYKARAIVLALDGDKAGQAGTERALEQLAKPNIKAYVLELPEGLDPDGFIKGHGAEAFAGLYADPKSGFKWRTRRIVEEYRNAQSDPERDRAKEKLVNLGATVDPLDVLEIAKALQALGVSLDEASEWLDNIQKKAARGRHRAAEY